MAMGATVKAKVKKKEVRITRHYSASVYSDGVAVLHHAPMTPFYFATGKQFHKRRFEAYRKFAQSGRTDIEIVRGYSFVIDYSRDGFSVAKEKSRFGRDIFGLWPVWCTNIYNWNPIRFFKIFKHFRKGEVNVGTITWNDFVERFGK